VRTKAKTNGRVSRENAAIASPADPSMMQGTVGLGMDTSPSHLAPPLAHPYKTGRGRATRSGHEALRGGSEARF
jgi:hypothetical protein